MKTTKTKKTKASRKGEVSPTKRRVSLLLTKKTHKIAEQIALEEDRSVSYIIERELSRLFRNRQSA